VTRSAKQYAEACERNKEPILGVLREVCREPGTVLEVGSGTGQHAAWFARQLPHLAWQPTDVPGALGSIEAWRGEAQLGNLMPARALDLFDEAWPLARADYVVCINTLHIAAAAATPRLFAGAARVLAPGGTVCLYGPFRYRGRTLEPSNARFDEWLRARDPASGVREFEWVDEQARLAGFTLVEDRAMPANNRLAWWHRRPG